MFFYDDNGDITLTQGDSGVIPFEDLPTDKNYTVFFSIYNNKRQTIGNQLSKLVSDNGTVEFTIPPELTDLLIVPNNRDTYEYYYGVKVCFENEGNSNIEQTCLIGNKSEDELNIITVYPKQTEGL